MFYLMVLDRMRPHGYVWQEIKALITSVIAIPNRGILGPPYLVWRKWLVALPHQSTKHDFPITPNRSPVIPRKLVWIWVETKLLPQIINMSFTYFPLIVQVHKYQSASGKITRPNRLNTSLKPETLSPKYRKAVPCLD